MDFCTRCGNELTSGDDFCGKCGNDVKTKRASVEHVHDHAHDHKPPKEEPEVARSRAVKKAPENMSKRKLPAGSIVVATFFFFLGSGIVNSNLGIGGVLGGMIILVPMAGILAAVPAVIYSRRSGFGTLPVLYVFASIISLPLGLFALWGLSP